MNQERKEKEQRQYFLELAKNDKKKLRSFIRLIDYIAVENLVKTNMNSMYCLLDSMTKGRKSGGMFNSQVLFDVGSMLFSPDHKEVLDALLNVLKEMVKIVENTSRVVDHPGLKKLNFYKLFVFFS